MPPFEPEFPFRVNTSFFKTIGLQNSHGAVIRVYDSAGNVIETREHAGDFVEP
jgi:hypothetical protein